MSDSEDSDPCNLQRRSKTHRTPVRLAPAAGVSTVTLDDFGTPTNTSETGASAIPSTDEKATPSPSTASRRHLAQQLLASKGKRLFHSPSPPPPFVTMSVPTTGGSTSTTNTTTTTTPSAPHVTDAAIRAVASAVAAPFADALGDIVNSLRASLPTSSGSTSSTSARVGRGVGNTEAERELKPPKFSNEKDEDFLEWKAASLMALNGKVGWTVGQKCRLALSCMRKSAAIAVQTLDPDDYASVDELMVTLEQKFVTHGATTYARQQFRLAKQEKGETLVRWHTRLLNLYRRAHPMAGDAEVREEVIERFLLGLADPNLGKEVMKTWPISMTEALNNASRLSAVENTFPKRSGLYVFRPQKTEKGEESNSGDEEENEEEEGVHQISSKKKMKFCRYCRRKGHIRSECFKRKADLSNKATGKKKKGKEASKKTRGKKFSRKGINQMAQTLAAISKEMSSSSEAEEEEDSPEPETGNGGSRV